MLQYAFNPWRPQKYSKALVLREINGSLGIEEVQLDSLRSNEALVEIHASGICHTDLSCMDGTLPAGVPNVFGHEGAGMVLNVGANITDFKTGDKVLLSFNYCGDCGACKDREVAYCDSFVAQNFGGIRVDGSHTLSTSPDKVKCHANFFGQSSFMRNAIVNRSTMVKVPKDTNLALFAPLGCGLQTGAGCVLNTLKVGQGACIAIFGVGAVGLAAVMAAKMVGAASIIVSDLSESRMALARELGATHTIAATTGNIVEEVRKICPPLGVQYAIDATGNAKVIANILAMLAPRGKAASVGVPKVGTSAAVDIFDLLVLGKQYIGCCEGSSDPQQFLPFLIQAYKEGKFPVEKLVKYYPYTDFQEAIVAMKSAAVIKPVLIWSSG
ncbi:alcohol dehydrogenase [Cadophora sp. MPI-SDFR-AT-0126]|nr:alcohol dehydrogenase [Leotiomycetes sp. MPI-SDFR-AT-0126]